MAGVRPPSAALARALDDLQGRYRGRHLDSDPVRYVHRYPEPRDQEVVAFLAAALAFGRVASIFKSLDDLLGRLGNGPAAMLEGLPRAAAARAVRGFRHRWVGDAAMTEVLAALGALLRRHGTLGRAFAAARGEDGSVRGAIRGVARAATAASRARTRGFAFIFPTPEGGSACKRVNLFLRWMVRRPDGIDLGLWPAWSPAELVIPLDTHLAFLGRALGLTRRRTRDWRMAEEITESLRHLDPDDPVKYDWALSRLGILGTCPGRRDVRRCPECPVFEHCRL